MPSTSPNLLKFLRVVVGACRNDPRDDAALLARFVEAGNDESAFQVLVWRHASLVWHTCRRILGDTPDAEDAFQTTFLALACKASQLRGDTLAGWLHRVARQSALDAAACARRRQGLERRLRAASQTATEEEASQAELYAVLDEELAALPERLRVPLVLRYLEGKTLAEVARILGCSLTPVTRRLVRGEAILRERLERRGLAVGAVAVLLTSSVAVSAVPARLIGRTARAAVAFHSETLTGGAAEAARAVLGALPSPLGATIVEKSLWIVLACALGLGGAALVACRVLSARVDESGEAGSTATQTFGRPGPGDRTAARVDCYGDSLPAHALARMGTTRLWRRGGWMERCERDNFAFSPDGKTLATHIDGKTVCLWDVATGKEIRRLTTEAIKRNANGWLPSIVSLGFSRDGKTLVAMNWELAVFRWEVATGKFLRKQEYQRTKRARGDVPPKVVFLPDGRMLGFGNYFLKSVEQRKWVRRADVWDIDTGKEICQLSRPMKGGEGWPKDTAFSSDGKILATFTSVNNVEKEAIISLWEVATGKEIRQLTYKDGCVYSVTFSPDSKTLASADGHKICVWEVATNKKTHLLQAGEANCGPLTYSPDSKTLVGGVAGQLWEVGTGKEIRSFDWKEACVALFSRNGKILAMGDRMGSIRLYEVATGREIGPRKGYRGPVRSVAYSPDGKMLASLGADETVRLWEVATGKEMRPLAKHTTWGSGSLAYSPDGKMLVSMDEVIHLWDTATGKEIQKFDENNWCWAPRSAVFSPDGKKVAACIGTDKTIRLWEVATGKMIYSLPNEADRGGILPWSPVFSPDGRILAAAGKENTVRLWEVATGQLIGQLGVLKQGGVVFSLAFSPDGRMLAISGGGGGDLKTCLWEVGSSREICRLELKNIHSWVGRSLTFSPDNRILAAIIVTDEDKRQILLWDVASGKEIGRLAGHQAPIQSIAFSPDGKTLASGSDDLTCLIWDITPFADRLRATPLARLALSQERLEAAWADLAKEPAKAYAAIRTLRTVPTQAIALLQTRVRPVTPVADPQQLQRWIADLDDNHFTVRDKAQREITELGDVAVPALRQALKGQPTLEAKRRLQALLVELEPERGLVSRRYLREGRAVQVLESIGTVKAREMLQALANGVPETSLTREARAALVRLAKRSTARP